MPAGALVAKKDHLETYAPIRESIDSVAENLAQLCPGSWEFSVVLAKLEEAYMWACAAIACNEKTGKR